MPIKPIAFTRPTSQVGTGQNDALVNALIKQMSGGARVERPMQGIDQLGQAALGAFLRGKARGTPSKPVVPEQADAMGGVELDPNGGFRTIGVAGNPRAARLVGLLPFLRRF